VGSNKRVLIIGGYGTFGLLLARELLWSTRLSVVLGGRNPNRLRSAVARLRSPERTTWVRVDLNQPASIAKASGAAHAVVCAAGPFQLLSPTIVGRVVETGAHWLDLSDDPKWIREVETNNILQERARASGLVVVPGLSTTPRVSSALIDLCRQHLPQATDAKVILFVGNRNTKGTAALRSALASRFGAGETVDVLKFGRRIGFELPSADAAVLAESSRLRIRFLVAPEWTLGVQLLRAARRGRVHGERAARILSWLSKPAGAFGTSLGAIHVTLEEKGTTLSAAVIGDQRLAILPCALMLEAMFADDHDGDLSTGDRARHFLRDPSLFLTRLANCGMEIVGPASFP
jgi:NAD(P)H-binding